MRCSRDHFITGLCNSLQITPCSPSRFSGWRWLREWNLKPHTASRFVVSLHDNKSLLIHIFSNRISRKQDTTSLFYPFSRNTCTHKSLSTAATSVHYPPPPKQRKIVSFWSKLLSKLNPLTWFTQPNQGESFGKRRMTHRSFLLHSSPFLSIHFFIENINVYQSADRQQI